MVLSNYCDVIHIVNERIVPKLDLGIYNRVANSDGVYSVGNMVHKRTQNYLFSTLKTLKKNLLNAEPHEMTIENQIHTYVLKTEENKNNYRPEPADDDGDPDTGGGGGTGGGGTGTISCAAAYSKTYRADVSGCASDREVTVQVEVNYEYVPYWEISTEGVRILSELWFPYEFLNIEGRR